MSKSQLSINNYQLPEGYKQTEVGVIPEDWDVVPLGNIATFQGGYAFRSSKFRESGKYQVVKMSNLYGGELDLERSSSFLDDLDPNEIDYLLNKDDVLISLTGTVGKHDFGYTCRIISEKNLLLNQRVSRIIIKNSIPALIEYETKLTRFRSQFFDKAKGGTGNQTNVSTIDLASIIIPLPSLIKEQRAIATTLSDVDALIAALDKLIAKKRHLKTATMQQLLTGKKRLPGFGEGKWEKRFFSEFALCRKERVDPRKAGVQEFCVELEHIDSGTGRLLGSSKAGEQASLKAVFYPGDVLFGKLRSYLRKYWLADCEGVCSTEMWVLVADPQLATPGFIHQIVATDEFIELASTAYGTHMPRADWNVVKEYEIELPSLEEQRAIAAVLSDMDAAIAALETRRTKTQAIKQGMMQQLLTGKVRLV
jgi:type I restriction enzyme S subunit